MQQRIWRKSSATQNPSNCVEISLATEDVLVRDSKDRAGPRLRFTPTAIHELLGSVSGRTGRA